jgi:hypothetical protein
MGLFSRMLVLTAAALLVTVAPAEAGQVIVVDGKHAKRVNDPTMPGKADIELPRRFSGAADPIASAARAAKPRADRRAVYRALRRGRASKRVSRSEYKRWRGYYVRSIRTYRKLRGARREQLGYVIDALEGLALRDMLSPTRMPAAFAQLERNRRYWPRLPYPAPRDQVSFKGSEIVYVFFPGEGLQMHPLTTFKKANLIHGACDRGEPGCDKRALRKLLDEMERLAVHRKRGYWAWEYQFSFDGGTPPWISGMAEATAIQAYGRAGDLLGDRHYFAIARRALPAFEMAPPLGIRTTGFAGGVHYLQYSFAPRLYIFNAFLQSLIGLRDFGQIADDATATRLFEEAEPEAEKEIPYSDVGDWTRYSYRGPEATRDYHELLREFLASLCTRRVAHIYCEYADKYRGYQVDPPRLTYTGPDVATAKRMTALRFRVSKLSAVEAQVYRGGKLVYDKIATFRRGSGSFGWKPRGPGLFTVRLGAKELRTGMGKKDRATSEIEVERKP